ncbi:MAG: DUF1501 domain-containing protein [Planctomycetes bacterium]|nr:DUF1501 domain-containing protein [Planctomycetota bacterium]
MIRFLLEQPGAGGRLSRREWLRIAAPAALAPAGLAASVRGETAADATAGFGKARSVIIVFASGGQSQLDSWDPKPDAPLEVRGAFGSIPTAVPGTRLCEHMPRLAKLADRYAIVRSMSHEDLDHGSAVYLTLTGHYHARRSSNPPPQPEDRPTHASILKRVRPESPFVEPALHVNAPAIIAPGNLAPGQYGGFLGREYDPLVVGDVTAGPVVIPGLDRREELSDVRIEARRSLLASLDRHLRRMETHRLLADADLQYRQAFEMLQRPETRTAFDLSRERTELRERYGRNRSGQACLLARRLVEAGVPLVTVVWNHQSRGQDNYPDEPDFYGWDTHNDIFDVMSQYLLPRFDQSVSALLEDLDGRGLLATTLVVLMGEFGRAPLVALEPRFAGASPGRKHWAAVYSIAAAGAGVAGGKVIGRSDRLGAYPASETWGPWDVAATVFSSLGIDPAGHYRDATDRPHRIAEGRPIAPLF